MTGELAYTVTFLEMDERPNRPSPPTPAGAPLALMRAEHPPTHFFLYLYRAVGDPYLWTDVLDWPEQKLETFVQDPNVELTVLYRAGSPAGFHQLDFRQEGVCDIAYFGLTPEATGHRIGPWLLDQAIHTAWGREIEKMTVNTCSLDHPKALALYQRAGFHPVRREERRRHQAKPDFAPAEEGREEA